MARVSIAENLEKILRVQAGMVQGSTLSQACKAAGTSSGTYKKWLERYADLLLPQVVAPISDRGAWLLSPDGQRLILIDDTPDGISLRSLDTTSGAEAARGDLVRPHGPHGYRNLVAAASSDGGERVVFLLSDGGLFSWETATGTIAGLPLDLLARGCELGLRSSSGVRRWSHAIIAPDLEHVLHWRPSRENQVLYAVRIADGAQLFHYVMPSESIPSAIVHHPRRPLVAVLSRNKLLRLLDARSGAVLIEEGPQVHSVSFSAGDTLLFDDWYGGTQAFNYQDGTKQRVGTGWGSHASLGTRYLTASEQEVHVRDTVDRSLDRVLPLDRIEDCQISQDGRWLAVRTDRVCVWDIDAMLRGGQATETG